MNVIKIHTSWREKAVAWLGEPAHRRRCLVYGGAWTIFVFVIFLLLCHGLGAPLLVAPFAGIGIGGLVTGFALRHPEF